jgi:carboxyl-terminal processing protease
MFAPQKVRLAWLVTLLLVGAAWSPDATVWGQVAEPANVTSVSESQGDLAVVLERGTQLERQRRWAEALTHYEEALRLHPQLSDLNERLHVARRHYDVCRRYADTTFTAMVDSLRDRDALSIYDEVLTKVNVHYVQEPNWQEVFQRGTGQLVVALSEPPFAEKQLTRLSAEQQASLRKYVDQITRDRKVADRQQAVESVDLIARAFQQYFQVAPQAVIFEYTAGAAGSLDDYSGFLTGSQMDEVFTQIEGNFVGLGVELKTEESALFIVNVIERGPAFEGGIRAGDRIVAVDGHTAQEKGISPDALADMLRGQEGSQVTVEIEHAGGKREQFVLSRRRVDVPSVDGVKLLDEQAGIGYFKIASFQKTTPRDVDAALWKLHGMGMRSLVIDLRGNPGGLLKAAVDVADKFVMDGMIVATRGRSPREDFDHRGLIAGTWRVPLVVLIDKDSASASEILAGAIQDHHRGAIVGERSYGKGSVQGIFPLNAANAGVRLTTAKWFTPSGQPISGRGVTPDTSVRTSAQPAVSSPGQRQVAGTSPASREDEILRAGLETARANLNARPPSP